MKVKFNPTEELAELSVSPPKPAIEYLPEWYKNMSPFFTKKPEFDATGKPNNTFKFCMPFLDSFSLGYIQELWTDIWFEERDGGLYFYYPAGPIPMNERGEQVAKSTPKVQGFYHSHYTWSPPWMPELPEGYSVIITHPFNRNELPFMTMTGIIDADSFVTSPPNSNIPFLLKEGFTGLLKKGTPLYQMIPFKRDSWESEASKYDRERQIKMTQEVRQHMWNGYKDLHWKQKEFK